MKNCSNKNCNQLNPQSFGSFSKCAGGVGGLKAECKNCNSKRAKKYNEKTEIKEHKRKYDKKYSQQPEIKEYRRSYKLSLNYGITLAQYNEMLINQNHKCKICKIDEVNAGKKGLYVDHNHKNSQIRGLLCGKCNSVLGYIKEDINILKETINYIQHYESLYTEKSNIIQFKKEMEI